MKLENKLRCEIDFDWIIMPVVAVKINLRTTNKEKCEKERKRKADRHSYNMQGYWIRCRLRNSNSFCAIIVLI